MPRIRKHRRLALALMLCLADPCHSAPAVCAETLEALRVLMADPTLPVRWRETTMDDGRPLVMSILERDGLLFLSFSKTHEGTWLEGAVAVCARGAHWAARFSGRKVHVGPAAHWAMRHTLSRGADITLTRLDSSRLRISTSGWSGTFLREAD